MGSFRSGNLSLHFGSFAAVFTIVPSGLRTAMAYAFGVRIITPSMTACPPTIRSLSFVLITINIGHTGEWDEYNNAGDVITGRVPGCNSNDRRHHAGIIINFLR